MIEPVSTCALATCGVRFIPSTAQVGAAKRGYGLYCCAEHQLESQRAHSRSWWRSPEGHRYAKARRRAAKKEKTP